MRIDVHAHIGRILPDRGEFMDATNLIAKMDAWGIDHACVLPVSEHPEGAYLDAGTEDVLRVCARHPDRLTPFCLIDPRFGNRKDMDFRPLLHEYRLRGCRGLGELLPKLDFDDPRCLNLYRQAAEFGFPVLFDMQDRLLFGTDSCARSDLQRPYPNIVFLNALHENHAFPPDALEKLSWRNAAELLGLPTADRP